jgi:hypothetical protein
MGLSRVEDETDSNGNLVIEVDSGGLPVEISDMPATSAKKSPGDATIPQ